MNWTYAGYDKEELKNQADEQFNELDLTVIIGYPFRQMARYTGNESDKENSKNKKGKGSYDLLIKSRDFKIKLSQSAVLYKVP